MNLDKAVMKVQAKNKSCITWVRKHSTLHLFPHNLQHIGTSFGIVIQHQWRITCLKQAMAQSNKNTKHHHQTIYKTWECHLFALWLNKVGDIWQWPLNFLYRKEVKLWYLFFFSCFLARLSLSVLDENFLRSKEDATNIGLVVGSSQTKPKKKKGKETENWPHLLCKD